MNDYALIEKILMVAGSILATYYALRERILKLESEVKGLHAKIATETDKIVELRKDMKERFDLQDRHRSELNKKIFARLDVMVSAIHKIEIRLARNETRTNLTQDPQHEND